jgi:hypothetical protein
VSAVKYCEYSEYSECSEYSEYSGYSECNEYSEATVNTGEECSEFPVGTVAGEGAVSAVKLRK